MPESQFLLIVGNYFRGTPRIFSFLICCFWKNHMFGVVFWSCKWSEWLLEFFSGIRMFINRFWKAFKNDSNRISLCPHTKFCDQSWPKPSFCSPPDEKILREHQSFIERWFLKEFLMSRIPRRNLRRQPHSRVHQRPGRVQRTHPGPEIETLEPVGIRGIPLTNTPPLY